LAKDCVLFVGFFFIYRSLLAGAVVLEFCFRPLPNLWHKLLGMLANHPAHRHTHTHWGSGGTKEHHPPSHPTTHHPHKDCVAVQ